MSEHEVIDAEAEEELRNLPAVRASEAVIARAELTVDEVVAQKDKILQLMERVMRPGVHYGLIPGVDRPSLFKPGAEAINVALRLAPHYESERIWHEDGHLTVVTKCELHHIPTGLVIGTAEGLCSSRESRYAWRNAKRACPQCGQETIIKGKAEYGGGFVCWKKEGGCGAKFEDGDQRIESQTVGKTANPEIADTWNTILKMSAKRAMIAADLNATAASDIFTQDLEDQASATAGGNVPPEEVFGESQTRAFDPSRMLLDGAPSGREAPQALADVMERLDPGLDWQALIAQATEAVFGSSSWRDLGEEDRRAFWHRLSNALTWISQKAGAGDFPPVDEETVQAGFAFAFEGWAAPLPLPRLASEDAPLPAGTDLSDDSVPFGEDENG